jgi:hypothetical protein
VCSSAGKRRILRSDALAARFDAAASADDVMALMAEFVADIRAGTHLQKGWPNRYEGLFPICCFAMRAFEPSHPRAAC